MVSEIDFPTVWFVTYQTLKHFNSAIILCLFDESLFLNGNPSMPSDGLGVVGGEGSVCFSNNNVCKLPVFPGDFLFLPRCLSFCKRNVYQCG